MGLDQHGYFRLSNPWAAALTVIGAVGLLLWCHLSRASDDSKRSVAVPVRARAAPRTPRPSGTSGRHLSCLVTAERGRRDASRQRVA
jgi:hypothetical protein